ncbi:MAG: AMP-binding protein, partial [Candidatus Omnitrophica bacterium]|nr:AMP-binding protein [Candidatus Omnitrophota bacterium]
MIRSNANLFETFCRSASDHSGRKCLIYKKENRYESLTYAQVLSEVLVLRRALARRGIKPGERVAVLLSNGPLWPVSFFAVVSLQAVAVPIDTQLNPEYIKEILRHAGVRCLLTEEKFTVALSDVLSGGIEVVFPGKTEPDAGPDECPPPRDGFAPSKLAALFYTSGTTQEQKAVMLTHANLLANVHAIHPLRLITKDDVVVSILPLHHTYPFMVTCLIPLLEGAGVCYVPSLVPHELFSALRENGVTALVAVPQLFALIERSVSEKMKKFGPVVSWVVQASLDICAGISKVRGRRIVCPFVREFHQLLGRRLRIFVSGGAKLDAAAASSIHRLGFAVMEGYGLTETAPIVTVNTDKSSQFGSVGKPLAGVDIKIVSPDNRGAGEVAVRGANVMLGYFRAPQLTRDVLKDGWFFTGDLGRMDRQGYLHLEGRKNEIIVLPSGKKVNPEEVEAAYMRSAFIKEICVFYNTEGPQEGHLAAVIVPDEDRLLREKHVDMHFKIRWELDACA